MHTYSPSITLGHTHTHTRAVFGFHHLMIPGCSTAYDGSIYPSIIVTTLSPFVSPQLSQMAAWLGDEGLPPDSSRESQLRLLWRSFQAARSRLSSVTSELEAQRSKHLAEMAEVKNINADVTRRGHVDVSSLDMFFFFFFYLQGTQIAGADQNFHRTQRCSGSGDSG